MSDNNAFNNDNDIQPPADKEIQSKQPLTISKSSSPSLEKSVHNSSGSSQKTPSVSVEQHMKDSYYPSKMVSSDQHNSSTSKEFHYKGQPPPPVVNIEKEKLTVDTLLDKLGSPGVAQIIIYILLCLNVFPVSLNFMAMSVYGKQSKESCPRMKFDLNGTKNECLESVDSKNDSLGPNAYIDETFSNDTDDSFQWALACEEPYKIRVAQSIFFAGVMIGGLFFGVLGDRFGRRPVVLITVYSQAVLGFVLTFSPHYIMFVILKFFQGMMLQGLQTSNTTMAMELPQTKYRTKAGMGIAMLATSCSMVIGLLSYLLPYWSNLQLTISVPTIITVIFLWLLPESFRWLLANQKEEDAMKVAQKYVNINKIPLPESVKDDIHVLSEEIASLNARTIKGNLKDLLKSSSYRRTSCIMFYGWFTAALVYYGITFSIPSLGGNMSLNFFIVGVMETISRFAGYFIIKKYGRRIPMATCFTFSGILCIASACTKTMLNNCDPAIYWLTTVMALVGGRVFMGQCFAYILIVTSEVFPTVLRTVSSGACAFWNRVGSTLAPMALLLNVYVGQATPFIVFGVMAIIAGGLTLFIPETLNVPLPDTIKDANTLNNTKKGIDNRGLENENAVTQNGTNKKEIPA